MLKTSEQKLGSNYLVVALLFSSFVFDKVVFVVLIEVKAP